MAGRAQASDGRVAADILRPLDDYAGSLGQRVYASLREAILTLTCQPGEALRKPEICAALGVSRSPVSEAVARLAAEGLVDVAPQSGTYVARLSMERLRESAFLREAIELAAVERVAPALTDDQIVQLRRNLRVQEALLADGDYAGFYATDMQMHDLILSFTGFRRLAGLVETSWAHVDRARRLLLPTPGRVEATLEEHRAIVEALADRDAPAAREALRRHLGQLLEALEPVLRDRPDLFAPA